MLDPHTNYGFGSFLDDYQQYADIPRWFSLSVYCYFTFRYWSRARKTAASEVTAWPLHLIRVFTAFATLWLIFLVPYELPRYSNWLIDRFDWYPLYLPVVGLIYGLGVKGYFISYRPAVQPRSSAGARPPVRSSLAPEIAEPAVQAVKKAMEQDRLWMDPGLNLGGLARHCGLPPKTLSAVLNQHLEKPFNQLVNEYRIAAFKTRLLQPESRELTIAGLAYDCGFNSLPCDPAVFFMRSSC